MNSDFRTLRFVVVAILAAGMTVAASRPAAATDLSGCWSGRWNSCVTRHSGVLRAHFTRCNDEQYRVEFSGRFLKIMPFRYTVVLNVVEESGDSVSLEGSSYLGRLVGTFSYHATATGCHFSADYSSCKDHGRFVMDKCP